MADNTVLNSGSGGDTIATDDISGVKHQRVKVEFGGDGSATDVSATSPLPVQISDGTDTALVGTDGSLQVQHLNLISTNNSSTSTLLASNAFTGTGDDVSQYSAVAVNVDASHDSAASGMSFEFSSDNTNWDDVYTFTYTAADGARRFQFPVTAQYFRVVYTNGGTGQTHFRLQTVLHRQNILTSIHRLANDTDPDRSANLVKAALIAQLAGTGDFTAVDATAGGSLKVAVEEIADNTVDLGAGNVGSGTQRVVIATDQAVLSVDDNAQSLTVDAPTGTPVNVQIGDGTDQVAIPTDGSTAKTTGIHALGTDGTNAQIISTNTSGHVNIADGGNIITVDGTVTANAGTGTLSTNTAQIGGNTVLTGAGATGTGAQRVTISGSANDVAVDGNPIITGLRGSSTEPTAVSTNGDAVWGWGDLQGRTVTVANHPAATASADTHGPYNENVTASGDTEIINNATAGESLYITSIWMSNNSATKVKAALREGAAGTIRWRGTLAADGGGVTQHFDPPWKLAAATDLTLNLPGTSDVDVNVHFFKAP